MANRMLKWFDGRHLADDLREVSEACADLAEAMDEKLAEGAEKTAGMRKLLEAKDCFVRAGIETKAQDDWYKRVMGEST